MTTSRSKSAWKGWLERLALHRPELRAWALYDWANSGMVTVIIGAVFPVYFYKVAGAELPEGVATQRFAIATTLGLILMAVLAPLLGAVADYAAVKKRMLAAFLTLGVVASASMYLIHRGDWLLALTLFVLAELGISGSFVFYDSLLSHIARQDEVDRLSASGAFVFCGPRGGAARRPGRRRSHAHGIDASWRDERVLTTDGTDATVSQVRSLLASAHPSRSTSHEVHEVMGSAPIV